MYVYTIHFGRVKGRGPGAGWHVRPLDEAVHWMRGTPDSLRAKPDGASVGELPNTTIEQMTLRLRIVLDEVFETG